MTELPETPPQPDADRLDLLLDLALREDQRSVPRALAARVLTGLRQQEDAALDSLLELAGRDLVDAPPSDLAQRVLQAARAEQRVQARRRFQWLPGGTSATGKMARGMMPRVAAAATILGLAFGAWRWIEPGASTAPNGEIERRFEVAEAPADLLEFLPILERWDSIRGDSVATDGADFDPMDLETLAALDDDVELALLLAAEENG